MGQGTRARTGRAGGGPVVGTRSPGSHLKCQQQEECFDAVETAIHEVPSWIPDLDVVPLKRKKGRLMKKVQQGEILPKMQAIGITQISF